MGACLAGAESQLHQNRELSSCIGLVSYVGSSLSWALVDPSAGHGQAEGMADSQGVTYPLKDFLES